jgi:hypothetical protein
MIRVTDFRTSCPFKLNPSSFSIPTFENGIKKDREEERPARIPSDPAHPDRHDIENVEAE